MRLTFKKIIDWLLVIFWLAVIFYFSSQPDLKSSLPNIWDLIFRKVAHFSEYFVLTYLFFWALKNYHLSFKTVVILAGFFSIIYAISDEFHQTFIFGRQGNLIDVLVDSGGVVVMTALLTRPRY